MRVFNWENLDITSKKEKISVQDKKVIMEYLINLDDKVEEIKKENNKIKKKMMNMQTEIDKIKLFNEKQKKYIDKIKKL